MKKRKKLFISNHKNKVMKYLSFLFVLILLLSFIISCGKSNKEIEQQKQDSIETSIKITKELDSLEKEKTKLIQDTTKSKNKINNQENNNIKYKIYYLERIIKELEQSRQYH
ncbi:MAG TPA: hypothetical protein VIL99_09150 [Ignavibacteria bacterium]